MNARDVRTPETGHPRRLVMARLLPESSMVDRNAAGLLRTSRSLLQANEERWKSGRLVERANFGDARLGQPERIDK